MLTFCNQYSSTVWLTIMWYHPNCPDGGDWEKAGWWGISPSGCANVFDADLDEINRYYCFYAEADDGTVWAGPYARNVPQEAFDWCEWTDSNTARGVGYRLLDIGDNDDFTVNLVR
jgi:uncharacterized membrane protein